MVSHSQIAHYAMAIGNHLQLVRSSTFGLVSTIAADLGYTVLFPSLLSGGILHIFAPENATDAHRFNSYCQRHSIDYIKITPSHLFALLEGASCVPSRCLVLGGEALPKELLNSVLSLSGECRIHNHYGPTECTVGALSCEVTQRVDSLPLGRPIGNTRTYILDEHQEPVSVGVVGELYIGGAGVARGYLNRPELTAERFVPYPHGGETGVRMYRTGDLGRWRSDGNIEFLGRNDFQVKVRGFRIELGEIEARMREHPAIGQAVVMAREDTAGDRRLVAYYTEAAALNQTSVEVGELRAFLLGRLPEYMVPAAYVRLESLPLTANGKLNRKALPAPDSEAYARQRYEAPQGEMEAAVAAIWAEVLKLERVGREDNFFELGGHSLLAVRVVSRVQSQLGKQMTVTDVFDLSSAGGAGTEAVSGTTVGAAAGESDGARRAAAAVLCAATFMVSGADGGRQRSVSRTLAGADAGRTGCRSAAAGAG